MGRHVAGLGGAVCVGGVHVCCVMLQRSALATRLAVAVVDRAPLRCLERRLCTHGVHTKRREIMNMRQKLRGHAQ